jgi:hypothetical protein
MSVLPMRTLIAAALITLLAVAAHAQGMGKGKPQTQPQAAQKTEDLAKKKADEKAYKDALDKIPQSTEKPDPWKTMR